ncbi:phosphatase PAP2 family protein [Cuneatibacter caecimuris]|uniref:PAP2 superfamily protein n=1 Tax=Cuneatibacter caecimuris TaxID=1796618 RepID=A0A4Q7PMZ0_9FIRM|nr:phosphatase PAP2 family protein [Cuneatibacter caecimuris]RZT02133.1 PAP2 superfamily protein [Cuneatibacter caecimuris]
MKLKNWVKSHLFLSMAIFMAVYLIWWGILEIFQFPEYHMIYSPLDDLIPFNEYFIIPYVLWFPLFPGVFLYLYFTDKEECWKYLLLLAGGMTVFLLISTFYPNGQALRPQIDADKNIFTGFLSLIWAADTPTNVFPSIHVYNAVAAQIAVFRSPALKRRPWIQYGLLVIVILICLATVFLKQHSVLDGIAALVLAAMFWLLIYFLPGKLRKKTISKSG